jgi:hypothetical protein
MFGSSRYGCNPIAFWNESLDSELLSFIQDDVLVTAENDEEGLKSLGYCRHAYQHTGHIYYEAYFHSMVSGLPINSMHPRFGIMVDKEAASTRLAAFFESIRRKNQKWCEILQVQLQDVPGIAAARLGKIIKNGGLFAGKPAWYCFP